MSDDLLIVIVDDDQSAREATGDLVRALGFQAVEFCSAADLLKSEERGRMTCLIADVQMPGMNGLDLYLQLSASGTPPPTVLMTAYRDEAMRERAVEAGVDFYLEKPLEADQLLACVRSAIEHRDEPARQGPRPH
ncbi:response regulator transcription factor [Microvirga subterranea]|nr:response regulator [Microvirga subterranea]